VNEINRRAEGLLGTGGSEANTATTNATKNQAILTRSGPATRRSLNPSSAAPTRPAPKQTNKQLAATISRVELTAESTNTG